jgi:hypothetical protein
MTMTKDICGLRRQDGNIHPRGEDTKDESSAAAAAAAARNA